MLGLTKERVFGYNTRHGPEVIRGGIGSRFLSFYSGGPVFLGGPVFFWSLSVSRNGVWALFFCFLNWVKGM